MVFRMELTYSEIENIIEMIYIDTLTTGYTIPPENYELSDIFWRLKSLLPEEVKLDKIFDDTRLKTTLTTNRTIRFTKKSFSSNSILGFTQKHSGPLNLSKESFK